MQTENICDKCNQPVLDTDNAYLLYLEIYGKSGLKEAKRPPIMADRHLFASDSCEGSPSLAQYFQNQPRDSRPWYPLNINRAKEIHAAYRKILEDVDKQRRILK